LREEIVALDANWLKFGMGTFNSLKGKPLCATDGAALRPSERGSITLGYYIPVNAERNTRDMGEARSRQDAGGYEYAHPRSLADAPFGYAPFGYAQGRRDRCARMGDP